MINVFVNLKATVFSKFSAWVTTNQTDFKLITATHNNKSGYCL